MHDAFRTSALILFAFWSSPLLAQEDLDHPGHESGTLEEIIVTGNPGGRSRFELLQGSSSLEGEALEEALGETIGQTLDGLPGLSQSTFGQGASRPVIRGLGGDRLRVLINDLGTFDVSTTSPDHAVALDVSTAEQVEVVRGPATLVYGANAIAGVVNVIDNRVPRNLPEDGRIDGFVRSRYATNGDETLNGGALNVNVAGGLMLHVDGFYRDRGEFKVPGFLRSRRLRDAEPLIDEEEPFGRAENSDSRNWGVTGGLSFIGSDGFIGASVSALNNNYGIPIELEEEEGESEEGESEEEEGHGAVRIDLEQIRFDLIGGYQSDFLIFEEAKLRFGYGDYDQAELEGDDVGTLFMNEEWEGRIDFVQAPIIGLEGSLGLQLRHREFEAIGAEAFVPANEIFQWGLYAYESYETGQWRFDGGLRFDRQNAKSPDRNTDRSFTGVSASVGASYRLSDTYLIGAYGFRNERAPNAEELFSNGPHLATFTFERGDLTLGEETVKGLELSFKKTGGPFGFALNAYYYDYDDFIFERFAGEEEDGLAVAQFSAIDSRFYGMELEAAYEIWRDGERTLNLDVVFDFVEAEEKASDRDLPRIPPLSTTIGLGYESHLVDLRIASEFAAKQNDTGRFELPTSGYTNVTASLTVHPFDHRDISFIIRGENLADEDIRYHTSFLKDLVPAPGRSVSFTVKAGF